MNTKHHNPAPAAYTIGTYRLFGFYGLEGIAEATVKDNNGRKCARLYRHPEGYTAETVAMSYRTEIYDTEAAALAALFASGEFAYFGHK